MSSKKTNKCRVMRVILHIRDITKVSSCATFEYIYVLTALKQSGKLVTMSTVEESLIFTHSFLLLTYQD